MTKVKAPVIFMVLLGVLIFDEARHATLLAVRTHSAPGGFPRSKNSRAGRNEETLKW